MAKKRGEPRKYSIPTSFEQARDELFSHILRCGVLEASLEHQKEWFDDTLLYLTDRFTDLTETELNELRVLGEQTKVDTLAIVAGQTPEVAGALKPIFAPILPHTPLQAAVFFGLLGGIASIYRGPMVVIGTGAALLAIILANNEIPIPYLYSIWLAPTVLQGSMDPTNSWTLWTIGHTKVSHGQFLRTALPFGCIMVAVNSLICYLMLGSLQ